MNPSKTPLAIPPRFINYLEKHRIYELFHELTTELVIEQPTEPISYLKEYFEYAARKRDVPRIILLAPPEFDKIKFAEHLQVESGVCLVTVNDLLQADKKNDCSTIFADGIAIEIKKILKKKTIHNTGWILIDFPISKEEALASQKVGILPTHVIEIVGPISEELQFNDSNSCRGSHQEFLKRSKDIDYQKHIFGIRRAYSNHLIVSTKLYTPIGYLLIDVIEVFISISWKQVKPGGRSMKNLGKDCATLVRSRKNYGAPCIFRIALIGPRGSGCRTIARCLSRRFNVIHVDFSNIFEQTRLKATSLSGKIRRHEEKLGMKPNSEIIIEIVKKRLQEKDCLERGWVLTGYPITLEDFKLLDQLDTSPNRIIFIDVDGYTCRKRLVSRKYNFLTGSKHDFTLRNKSDIIMSVGELGVHPKDYRSTVEQDIDEYEKNVSDLKKYAGESAVSIDGNVELKILSEKIEALLMRVAPGAPPRLGRASLPIDISLIEFKPDDELE